MSAADVKRVGQDDWSPAALQLGRDLIAAAKRAVDDGALAAEIMDVVNNFHALCACRASDGEADEDIVSGLRDVIAVMREEIEKRTKEEKR